MRTHKSPAGSRAFASKNSDPKLPKSLESCKPEPLIDEETARGGVLAPAEEPTAQEKFLAFHEANPRVYEAFVRLARMWVASTRGRKIGIGALTERVRWELSLATTGDEFKINNNHRSFYARLLMVQEPDLAGIFELRHSVADDWDMSVEVAHDDAA
jgi:hypothetical protein